MPGLPAVSIILPAYNEAEDIAATLEALCRLDGPAFEVLLVDDASTDDTVAIAEGFAGRLNLRVLRQPRNRGVAAARNAGLAEAQGEIALFLNADVLLPPDFLHRSLPHYEQGCDYLIVDSVVANASHLYPRYVQLMHVMQYSDLSNSEWSEGYTCRRAAALAVGGFPEQFPGASGEDAVFGQHMRARFRKCCDATIEVPHIAPASWRGFWSQRIGRGRGTAYFLYSFQRRPITLFRMLRGWLGLLAQIGLLYPLWGDGLRLARLSPRGWRDWLPMTWARGADMVAQQVGHWRGIQEITASTNGG